jgi:hypothetical protein
MDGDHFQPSGFGVGAAASLAVGIGAAMISAGNNVADVVAEYKEAEGWDRINATLVSLNEHNANLRRLNEESTVAFANLMAQFHAVASLALQQSKQLDALRARGLIS